MTLDRDRLVRILGMLGSEHEGERAVAGAQAARLVREAGLTWDDLVYDPSGLAELRVVLEEKDARIAHLEEIVRILTRQKELGSDRQRAADCLEHEDELTDWEADFLRGFVKGRFRTMTERQKVVLERIEEKLDEVV